MSKRTDLISTITSNIASYTAFKVSDELPFISGETPLYRKNMKTVYIDQEDLNVTEYAPTFSGDIMQTETAVKAYLTTDAKNQPSDIDSVVTAILAARDGVTNVFEQSSQVETDIADDHITYNFEFNFTNL